MRSGKWLELNLLWGQVLGWIITLPQSYMNMLKTLVRSNKRDETILHAPFFRNSLKQSVDDISIGENEAWHGSPSENLQSLIITAQFCEVSFLLRE